MPLIGSLFSDWNVGSLWQAWRTSTRNGALVTTVAIGSNDVDRIVQKCVAHNLSERYPSVSELIADVENLDVPAHSISGSGDEA